MRSLALFFVALGLVLFSGCGGSALRAPESLIVMCGDHNKTCAVLSRASDEPRCSGQDWRFAPIGSAADSCGVVECGESDKPCHMELEPACDNCVGLSQCVVCD